MSTNPQRPLKTQKFFVGLTNIDLMITLLQIKLVHVSTAHNKLKKNFTILHSKFGFRDMLDEDESGLTVRINRQRKGIIPKTFTKMSSAVCEPELKPVFDLAYDLSSSLLSQ